MSEELPNEEEHSHPIGLPVVSSDGCWIEYAHLTPKERAHLHCVISRPEWDPACDGECRSECPVLDEDELVEPEEIVGMLPDDIPSLKETILGLIKHMQKMGKRKP